MITTCTDGLSGRLAGTAETLHAVIEWLVPRRTLTPVSSAGDLVKRLLIGAQESSGSTETVRAVRSRGAARGEGLQPHTRGDRLAYSNGIVQPGVMVTSVPYQLQSSARREDDDDEPVSVGDVGPASGT
ncbi:MAG: hypothetical protein NVSMB55_07590 [Mycobacteriales bacterium]